MFFLYPVSIVWLSNVKHLLRKSSSCLAPFSVFGGFDEAGGPV